MPVPPIPRRDLPATDYAVLVQAFRESGFTTSAICQRLQLAELAELDAAQVRQLDYGLVETVSDALTYLFVQGRPLDRRDAQLRLPPELLQLLERAQLVEPFGDSAVAATVSLYPIEHLYIATDRYNNADGSPYQGWDDLVYACLFRTTEAFLHYLPRNPAGDVLDLCSGCGVGALLSAPHAERTYAFDITGRSREFAIFNAKLNGVANLDPRTGDLYEPAGTQQFDRIVAHPPYQPVVEHALIFNSGGLDGEQITRGIVTGAPRHLKPGGRLFVLCQITDRDLPVEHRVRQWLGASHIEFDVAFVVLKTFDVQRYTAISTLQSKGDEARWRGWMRRLTEWKVKEMVYGLLTVQRREEERPVFTIRRMKGTGFAPADFERLIRQETEACQPDFVQRLQGRRLKTARQVTLTVTNQLAKREWQPQKYVLRSEGPFDYQLTVDAATAYILTRFDGSRSVRDCLVDLQKNGVEATPGEFAQLVRMLLSAGILTASA
jgi:hypothetical protein